MLTVYSFCVNFIQENTYLLCSQGEAAIIDCGASSPEEWAGITRTIATAGVKPRHYWLTHAHFDHIIGSHFVVDTYGLRPRMHAHDVELYHHINDQTRTIMGQDFQLTVPNQGRLFEEDEVLTLGDTRWHLLHTPGHTQGGVCFYCEEEKTLISGDSLFRYSIGRTDLPGGNEAQLIAALREKILPLPDDVKVYTGHGAPTTIGEERRGNPYL